MTVKLDKTKETRLWGVTTQNSDVRLTTGDSTGGTFTGLDNPLRGSLMWDQCMYVLQDVAVAGGATGGSYTVTIETDAVNGFTALPIARVVIGPDSPTTVVLDNLHQGAASPLPTHIFIDQTATGGGASFQVHAFAKQYRGYMGSPAVRTAERVITGTMTRANAASPFFSGSEGLNASTTLAVGTSVSDLGMGRMRLWDSVCYWVVAGNSVNGGYDVDMVGTIDGTTFTIATTGTGSALNAANEKLAIANNFYGQSPNPSAIIWTENSAGDGISDVAVVVMAKSGRGSLAKS